MERMIAIEVGSCVLFCASSLYLSNIFFMQLNFENLDLTNKE